MTYKTQKLFLTLLTLVKILNCLFWINTLKMLCSLQFIFYLFKGNTSHLFEIQWSRSSSITMERQNFLRSLTEKKKKKTTVFMILN